VVEDDRLTRVRLEERLSEAGYTVRPAEGVRTARRLLADTGFDAVLMDIGLRDGDGLQLLEELRGSAPNLPVIMVTGYGDSERTIRAMQAGAFDYVTKPFDLDALLQVLERAVRAPSAAPVDERAADPTPLVGASPAMLAVWKAVGRAAGSRVPVLITGESGTGKELVARAIHEHGPADRPFVPVNIAALPSSLVESELFGHERGAFTGAVARREGRFEAAGEGTLFLDEIADLELPLQTKLLRVLEDGGYERVGDSSRMESQARIISATARPVTPGPGSTLREDLYYRLAVLRIDVPPLRERRADIPLLVQAFLRQVGGPTRAVSEPAMAKLMAFSWPGNVRQLRNHVQRAVARGDARLLVPEPPLGRRRPSLRRGRSEPTSARQVIDDALLDHRGRREETAAALGISRSTLYRWLRDLGR